MSSPSLTPQYLASLSASQIAALTASQLGSLGAAQVAAIVPAGIAAIGANISVLTNSGFSGLTVAQLAAVTSAQAGVVTGGQAATLTAAQIAGLSASAIAALSSSAVSALTGSCLAAFNAAQVAALGTNIKVILPANFAMITPAAMSGITVSQVTAMGYGETGALSAAQIAVFSPAAITALGAKAGSISAAAMSGLSAAQIAAFATTQTADFVAAQTAALSAAQVAALSAAQVAAFTPAAITALGANITALSPAAIAGLSSSRVQALTAAQLGALTAAQAASLSATQVQYLGNSVGALSAAAVGALGDAQIGVLTGPQFAALGNNVSTIVDFGSVSSAALGGLTAAQAAALLPAQISLLTATRLAAIAPSAIVGLGANVSAINPAVISGMTSAQLAALTGAQFAALTGPQAAALSVSQIQSLTTGQIAGLGASAVSALTSAQLAGLSAAQLAALGGNVSAIAASAISALSATALSGLTAAQAGALTTAQIGAFSSSQLGGLAPAAVAGLGNAVTAISPSAIGGLTPAALAALGPNLMSQLSTPQLASLSQGQIQSLSSNEIASLSSSAVAALTAPELSALSATQVAALGGNISVIDPNQIPALTPAALAGLTAAQASSLTMAQLAWLSAAQVNALTTAALGGLAANATALNPTATSGLSPAAVNTLTQAQANAQGVVTAANVQSNGLTEVQASSVVSFTDSLGVNMCISADQSNADQNVAAEENALNYVDVKLVRGGLYSSNAAAYTQMNQDLGVKYDFLVDGSSTSAFNSSLQVLEANPNMIAYIEGPNESDEPGETTNYNGLTGLAATSAEMQTLYTTVHSDTQLAGVPVIQASFGFPTSFATYGDHAGTADYTSSHLYYNFYPWGSDPLASNGSWLNSLTADAENVTPNAIGNIATETGYETLVGSPNDISQIDQAKYILDDVFDLWNLGFSKTFIYNLFDDGASSPYATDPSNNYGIYNGDWSPKPAAIAVHNLMTLLSDAGTGGVAPGTLDYALSGEPSSVQTTLLEKSDGTFVLAIWNEVKLQNASGVDTPVAAVPVTLTLGSAFESITIYDPLTGTSAVQSFANAQTVQIMVPDHPVLIEISNTAPAPVIAAAGQPIINAPSTVLAAADSVTRAGGISVANDTVGNITVQVNAVNGTLSMQDANGQALAGSGTDCVTLRGPAAIVNAELATLAYASPVSGGDDTISLRVTGSTGAVVTDFIAVNNIAIPTLPASIGPLLSVQNAMTVATGSNTAIGGSVLTDVYYETNPGQMSLTVTAGSGEVQMQSNGVALAAAQSLTVTGSYAQLAADLATLSYVAGSTTGTDTLSFHVTDPSGAQNNPTMLINVAPPLSINGPASGLTLAAGSSGNVGVQISDTQAAANADELHVTITDSTGTLTMLNGEGNPTGGSGSHSISVAGSPDWINGELATLVENASTTGGSDTITVTAQDAEGATATSSFNVNVVSAVAVSAPGSVPVSTGVVTAVSGVAVSDSAAAAQMTVVVKDSFGALSMTDGSGNPLAGAGSNSITLTGSLATVNAELATLTYTGPVSAETDAISITASDVMGGSSSSIIAVPISAVGTPPAYFWLGDTAGDGTGRQAILGSGSLLLTTSATGLNGAVTEQAANGVATLTANQWNTAYAATVVDNTAGNSYVLNNFRTANATLLNGTTAAGGSQSLTINGAQNGSVVLGSGSQNVVINAGLGGATPSTNNTFNVTEGSGTDMLTVNGYAGNLPTTNLANVTVAGVTAGSGTDVMTFVNAHGSVKAGSGALTVYGSNYGTNVTAGTGTADVWGGSGWNTFTYHTGDGAMTIEDFSNQDTLQLDSSLQAGMTETTISGGVELSFSSSPQSEVVLKGQTTNALSHVSWS